MVSRATLVCTALLCLLGAIHAEKAVPKLSCPPNYSIAVLSDIHIGEASSAVSRLKT